MKRIRALALVFILLAVAGCTSPDTPTSTPTSLSPSRSSPTPATATLVNAPATAPPTPPNANNKPTLPSTATIENALEVPAPTIAASQAVTATIVAQLQATVIAGVKPTSTPDTTGMSPFGGIDGVSVMRLRSASTSGQYWLAYSTGTRMVLDNPPQQHFVAVYEHKGDAWTEIARTRLANPDYVSDGSVAQVDIEPTHCWIAVDSGVGAHGGCFDLLSFDGKSLKNEVSTCATSPGAGSIQDLDGDGKGEIVLNATDNYVFCYACGMRLIGFQVMRWDGTKLVDVQAQNLPASAPADLKQANDRAVELFTHSLMKDAEAQIEKAYSLDPKNETVVWNRALIKLHAQARKQEVADSGYPLLANAFYGDYAAALNAMRPYSVDDLLAGPQASPLISGTTAEGNSDALISYLTSTTNLALEAEPDLVGAYYLRGWAAHMAGGHDSEALADFQKAASLDPSDKLFSTTLARLKP